MDQKKRLLIILLCGSFYTTNALSQIYYPEDIIDQQKAKDLEEFFINAHIKEEGWKEKYGQREFIEICSNHISSELEGAESLFFPNTKLKYRPDASALLVEAIEKTAYLKLKLRSYDDRIVQEFFSNLKVSISGGLHYRDTELGGHQSIDVYLATAYAIYGLEYPGVGYEDGCGGAIEINVRSDPPGARIWWSTPFRQAACQSSTSPEECQWREVTDNSSILANGDRIFRAQWPDGKNLRTIRTGDDFESGDQLVLRPDLSDERPIARNVNSY